MALFSDGTVSTIEDLTAYESSILEVANTERIDLTVKLKLAEEEIGIDLEALLAGREGAQLGNVVVTEPLHKWHTFQALGLSYRDAFHQQLNDRYQEKWQEYQRLARWAKEALYQTGLGMVSQPVPKAEPAELSLTAGGGQAARTYYVRVAWRNAAGVEGAPSEVAVLAVSAASLLVVQAAGAPAVAAGWNVYVGTSVAEQARQNNEAIPVGQNWTEPVAGLAQGAAPGKGQTPEYFLRAGRLLQWG